MKKTALLLILFVLVFQVSATDAAYNRLKKLYESDPAECLVMAKKYMQRFPAKAAPYYFAAVVFKDKVEKAKNTRGKYFHMNKALGFAKKFEDLEDLEIQNMVVWKERAVEFEATAKLVIAELMASEYSDLGIQLGKKLVAFDVNDASETSYLVTAETDLEERSSEDLNAVPLIVKVPGQYYGLATGKEIVKSSSPSEEQELLKLINAERKKLGMNELIWAEDLARACRYHAFDQGTQGYFNHDSYDRSGDKLVHAGETFDRINKFNTDETAFVNSENIAAGNESAEATYQQWYKSPGHYDNMFNKSSKKVGIGVYHVPESPFEFYWVFCTAK